MNSFFAEYREARSRLARSIGEISTGLKTMAEVPAWLGLFYSLLLLSKCGKHPRESRFYSFKLIHAFDRELWDIYKKHKEHSDIENYHRAYQTRFFESFADWFGLVNITYKSYDNRSWLDRLAINLIFATFASYNSSIASSTEDCPGIFLNPSLKITCIYSSAVAISSMAVK